MERVLEIEIGLIEIRDRLRPVSPAGVEALAAMISEHGLEQPVLVRPIPGSNRVQLVAGAHRVAAVNLLGLTTIRAILRECSDAEARIIEIDENVGRVELSQVDRAVFLATRKEIYEAMHPETVMGKAKKPKKGDDLGKVANFATFARFSKDAARATGLSERTIQLAVQTVSDLSPAIIAHLRASPFADNQAQIMALARQVPDHRLPIAEALATGQYKSVQAAKIALGLAPRVQVDEQEQVFLKLSDAWSRANAKTRRRFLHHFELAEAPRAGRKAGAKP
jgi:ParB family chromosome partitioning protein